MGRLAILAGAGALAVLAACEPHPEAAVPVTDFPLRSVASCGAVPSGSDFVAAKVHVLDRFAFADNGMVNGVYKVPTVLRERTPVPYATDLARAFELAPPYLQTALCQDVDDVLLDLADHAPFGWAFWEVPGQGSGQRRYVAIGGKLWSGSTAGPVRLPPPVTIGALETLILGQLLNTGPGVVFGTVTTRPALPPGADVDPYAILAVFARETGLVINHDQVRGRTICGAPPFRQFKDISWVTTRPFSELGHIHMLGEEANPLFEHHARALPQPSAIRQFSSNVFPVTAGRAIDALQAVYGTLAAPAEWANLLAETTPDDDFVETYRMIVLHDANLESLVVPLGGSQPNVMTTIADPGPILAQKVGCVRTNFAPARGAPPVKGRSGTPAPAPR